MIDTYNAFGGEKVLNFATEDLFDKHPRTIIKEFKQAKCWYIEDE